MMTISPVDPDKYIGTVTVVNAGQVQANLPLASAHPERRALSRGAVGDFVFVDCERTKLLGRITEVKIPDAERLSVEPHLGASTTPNPIGRIQLLATVVDGDAKLSRGVNTYPKIGDGVFLASAQILAQMIGKSATKADEINIPVGVIEAGSRSVTVDLPPEKLFGRHCGIFGATGGGKSWTIASLIEKIKEKNGKAIVFDPTGEFCDMAGIDTIFAFEANVPNARHVHFPYTEITEDDLFSLFRPSGQSQGPKLRDAVKSLKLVRALGQNVPANLHIAGGVIEKANRQRAPYFDSIRDHAIAIHSPKCNFDITNLSEQIKHECVWGTANNNANNFGGPDNNAASYCESLASRIATLTNSRELECIFQTHGDSLVDEIANFLDDDERDVALISFKEVRFEHNTRELLLNIIGRYLLGIARDGRFWGTYRQWQEKGAQVRKGEKSSVIIFYRDLDPSESASSGNDDEQQSRFFVARASRVFNAAQVDGYEIEPVEPTVDRIDPCERAEQFIQDTGANITVGGTRAYYTPSTDRITMPDRHRFVGTETSSASEGWYSTLLHELTHWSGASSRCDRTRGGSRRWKIRLDESLRPDITICVRMDEDNMHAHDYYILPRMTLADALLFVPT